jgi:outer membrane receptor protein involved in Fe transport
MTTVTKTTRILFAAVTGWLVATTTADAQQTTPPPRKETDIITLSPFEVSSTKDTGYAGQDTLAGSRLRTNLRDIPAAISPITAEFISDIAAVNVEDVMEYAPGARMEVDDGRASPVGENVTIGSQPIRIRGLPGGGRSINFFQWGGGIGAPAEIDMYMVESAELSRGPNSILFGIGSPAGRFNVATKQARTDRPRYSLSHRIDNWDGQRWVADLNSPLIKDRLAVRAVALRGRDASWRAAGHSDQDRVFLSTKWQPDRKTSVRVEFEDARIDRFTSRPSFGIDLKSFWEASGRPLFNNFDASYVPGTPGTGAVGTPGSPIRDTGVNDVVGTRERVGGDFIVVSPSFQFAQNYRQFTASDYSTSPLFNDFAMGRANPKATPEANWVNAKQNVQHGSVFITRELASNLNLELAFNRMVSDLDSFNLDSWGTYGIAVDTNRYLPNGQLKPAGQLYHYDVSQERRLASQAMNQYRVALAYERTWRDDLVRLRMAGLGERSEAKWQTVTQNMNWLNGPSLSSGGAFNPFPEVNRVWQRFYISDLASIYDPNFRIPGPIVTPGTAVKYQDPRTGVIRDIYPHLMNRNQANTQSAERNINALMGVAQLYLFRDRFVGTFGYRKDKQKQWVGTAFRDPAARNNNGVWLPGDPSAATPSVFTGGTRTLGGIFHVTPWASVFYNTATSLGTPGTLLVAPADPNAAVADIVTSPEGNTRDYGVKLSFLNKRLFLTAAKFHTQATNDFSFSGLGTYRNWMADIWRALAESGGLNPQETAYAETQKEVTDSLMGYLVNSESKGLEVEVVGRVTDAWSLSVNYTKMESKRSEQAREFRAYLDHHKPFWKKYGGYNLGQTSEIPGVEFAPNATDWRTPAQIAANGDFTINSDSINETIADIEAAFFLNPHIFEGTRFVGDPGHSINLRTRYDFREGLLKGLSAGLGTRLRYGRVSGARSDYTFAPGTDYTDKWNGRIVDKVSIVEMKDQNVWDLHFTYKVPLRKKRLDWRVQLNINNVLDEAELIVNNVHPVSLVPTQYRYQNPRQFILTNTVSF